MLRDDHQRDETTNSAHLSRSCMICCGRCIRIHQRLAKQRVEDLSVCSLGPKCALQEFGLICQLVIAQPFSWVHVPSEGKDAACGAKPFQRSAPHKSPHERLDLISKIAGNVKMLLQPFGHSSPPLNDASNFEEAYPNINDFERQ